MTGLRRYGGTPKRTYVKPAEKRSRTVSVWITPEDEEYVERVARRLKISKNRAFAVIIEEHRANGH